MKVIYSMRSLKVARAQTFDLLEAKGLTFILIKVRFLLFGKKNFPFLSLLCDTIRGCCWMIASIIVSIRTSSIKVLLTCRLILGDRHRCDFLRALKETVNMF